MKTANDLEAELSNADLMLEKRDELIETLSINFRFSNHS